MKHHNFKKLLLASALAVAINGGAVVASGTPSTPISKEGIIPYIIDGANPGGNRTCGEVGLAFFNNATTYSCYSARSNYESGAFDKTFVDLSGNDGCKDTTIDVSVTGNTLVSWSSTGGTVGAAIVKGSAAANVYNYMPQIFGDSGLASPVNPSNGNAGLSNLTFCWNPDPKEPPACYESDTAWGAGSRYITRGNWATYTAYGADKTVDLYAGQTKLAGAVHFSAVANGKVIITINLNEGWRFRMKPVNDVEGEFANNVHVNGYAATPAAINPAPGSFPWVKVAVGSSTSIEVDAKAFYGVHADVEKQVACPVEEETPE